MLGLGYPEALGGTPADLFYQLIVAEEFARCGAGGVQASLNSHSIALPPILKAGSEELKQRVIPPVLAGEKIAARDPKAGALKPIEPAPGAYVKVKS